MLGDLAAPADPDAVVAQDVIDETGKRGGARGLAETTMQSDGHHLRRLLAFAVERGEIVAQRDEEILHFDVSRQTCCSHPSLAVGALSFSVPVLSLGTGAAVAVCFSPEEDCTAFAVDAIDRAETQILVNAYSLTTSSRTVEALVRAKQRGVDVRLIADRTTPCERNSGIDPLARAGIPGCGQRAVR